MPIGIIIFINCTGLRVTSIDNCIRTALVVGTDLAALGQFDPEERPPESRCHQLQCHE